MDIKQATAIRVIVSVFLVAATAICGLAITYVIADYQRTQYFEVRKYQASAAAAALDWREVAALKGDKSDVGTPAFEKLRRQLVAIKDSDMRIRFVYLMRVQDGKMIFLVDAENPSSKDYSPPGMVYYEAKKQEIETLEGKVPPAADVYGPVTDRWGSWISATDYILGPDGKPIALLGTDVDVKKALASFNQIRDIGTVSDFIGALLVGLVLLQWILWRYHRDRREELRLQMEESMMRLNTQLMEADRLKNDFIEAASHELKGPVTAVNVALHVLRQQLGGELSDTGKDLVTIAQNGSERLVELVDDLLDMTKIEAGDYAFEPQDTEVATLVSGTAEMFMAMAAEKGLKLTTDAPKGIIEARLDPQALRRVLENMITNAIKYTDSGDISVEVEPRKDKIIFTVRDTGRGIPKELQDEVFEKFSRLHLSTDSRERGAGLGLAISKGLVEAQGGRIWVESEEGKGSAFHFELPRNAN